MTRNHNYCRPVDGGRNIEYAPTVLPPSPCAPTEAEYLAAGWYKNAITPPAPPEGKVVASVIYEVIGMSYVGAIYTYDDAPVAARTYSKLKLYAALAKAGLWDALEAWLKTQTVEGVNAWTAFSMAQDLTEDHPMFGAWCAAAKSALGVTDAEADAILDEAEIE